MKIGLVLGGGGARGFAHIGVLRAMEEHDLEPVAIAGCSMGGIVGGMIAAGYDAAGIEEGIAGIKTHKILDRGRGGSLVGGKGIANLLDEYLPDTFADLRLPLAVTAVDVQKGEMIVYRQGELRPALRATSAIPGVIEPVEHEDRILVDGGLLNNVPVDVIRTMTHRSVLAVDVAAPPDRRLVFEGNFLQRAREARKKNHRPLMVELFMKAYDIPTHVLTRMRLSLNPPELLIRPALDPDLKTEDFKRMEEAIEAGYRAASRAFAEKKHRLEKAE
jgi:NTE family protein